jgi:DNA-binding NtrC family response regulator
MSATARAATDASAMRKDGLRNVLIVDDDSVFRATLADGLATVHPGLSVFMARDGREAVALMNGRNIDLVITDLRMPAMGGLELTQWINELWPQTPVIVMSAYADAVTVLDLSTQGNYFFDKPVDFGSLVRTVDSLLH